MAINYGNLVGDVGEIYNAIVAIESFGTSMLTAKADVVTQLTSSGETDLLPTAIRTFDNIISSTNTMLNSLSSLIQKRFQSKSVINELPSLSSISVQEIISELMDDMTANSETLKKSILTVGSITTTTVNASTGTLIVTKKLPGNENPGDGFYVNPNVGGVDSQLTLDDSFVVTVDEDDQDNDGGNEVFQITSLQPMTGAFNINGGGNRGLSDFLPVKQSSIISNFFGSFTSDVPNGWTALDAADYDEETSVVMFAGTSCLKIVSAGTLSYDFSDDVEPGQVLNLSFYARKVTGETGTLNIKVYVNGSAYVNATINNGDVTNSSWTLFNYDVVIPQEIGSCYIEIISASITNGYYIDNGALSPFHYHAGLGFAVTRGIGLFVKNDDFRFTTSNNDAGKLQRVMARVFGIQPPTATSGSETISDP